MVANKALGMARKGPQCSCSRLPANAVMQWVSTGRTRSPAPVAALNCVSPRSPRYRACYASAIRRAGCLVSASGSEDREREEKKNTHAPGISSAPSGAGVACWRSKQTTRHSTPCHDAVFSCIHCWQASLDYHVLRHKLPARLRT